ADGGPNRTPKGATVMRDLPGSQMMATVFTEVSSDTCRLALSAYYFQSPIDLNLLRTHYLPSQILSADPLVLSMPEDAHVVVLHFGAVIFWQCPWSVYGEVLDEIQHVMKVNTPHSEVRDALVVLVG